MNTIHLPAQQGPGWNAPHTDYACTDTTIVRVRRDALEPHRMATLLQKIPENKRPALKTASRSEIVSGSRARVPNSSGCAITSGLLLSRDMRSLIGLLEEQHILALPRSVRRMPPGMLKTAPYVRSALVGDDMWALTGEFQADEKTTQRTCGTFQESYIRSVSLPKTLRHVGAAAFQHCWQIARVSLPEGVQRLGPWCFADSCVKVLELPRSIVRVDPDAFANPRAELSFASGTEVIPPNVLRGCKCGTVVLPASVREIREGAFARAGLKMIDFGTKSNLERICAQAFRGAAVESVLLPNTVVSIGESAFRDCRSLRRVDTLSRSALAEIGPEAFRDSKIREFLAPESLRVIGDAAFLGCSDLEKVRLNAGLQVLGFRCFGEEQAKKADMSKQQRAAWTWKLGDWMHVRELALPDGLERVGEQWLYWSSVERVSAPRSVRVLEKGAFESSHLREVIFCADSLLCEIGPDCFHKTSIQGISVPGLVEQIGSGAFRGCATLKRVDFQSPSRLWRIGENALSGTDIKQFTAPSGLKEIGAGAFQDCKKLKQAILNIGLETLGDFAFSNCPLTAFNFPQTLLTVGENAFSGCRKIKTVHLQTGKLSVKFDKNERRMRSKLAVASEVQEIGFSLAYQIFGLQKAVFQKRS